MQIQRRMQLIWAQQDRITRQKQGGPILGRDQLKRLYSLDALRGLAALSVVFWHWQLLFGRRTPATCRACAQQARKRQPDRDKAAARQNVDSLRHS
jgi:uncharacterized membrane protein